MPIIIETEDPGVRGVRKAVKRYCRQYPELAPAMKMYGAIMEIQQEALRGIDCGVDLSGDEIEKRLSDGEPLLDPLALELDWAKYRELAVRICQSLDENKPGGFSRCDEVAAREGLGGDHLAETRDMVLKGEEFEPGSDWAGCEDGKIVQKIFWESLVPFYRKCGSVLQVKLDQSLWQRGFCPVCGSRPLMGKFRKDDGLWLLECALCHTLWSAQRAKCPFCDGGGEGSLDYLYIDGDRRRRVQYCSLCRRYVKTIDLREGEENVILPLEDIATFRLDRAAEQESLRPA